VLSNNAGTLGRREDTKRSKNRCQKSQKNADTREASPRERKGNSLTAISKNCGFAEDHQYQLQNASEKEEIKATKISRGVLKTKSETKNALSTRGGRSPNHRKKNLGDRVS